MKVKNYMPWIAALEFLAAVLLTVSCHTGRGGPKHDAALMTEAKPTIDTSKVLETIELYRAKRYEGIQDALNAGIENAHKLVLYGRKMGSLPPEIGRLTYLQTLDVAFNDLTELPGELATLHYLQGFYANGNLLTEFPRQILLLPILSSIDLSENQIREIPAEIVRMAQLTRLSIERNTLTKLPVEVYELGNLNILELGDNGLSEIPEGIGNLEKLRKLDLSNNQLTSLPGDITRLSGHLEDLMIQGNPIPRKEIERLIEAMPSTRIRY